MWPTLEIFHLALSAQSAQSVISILLFSDSALLLVGILFKSPLSPPQVNKKKLHHLKHEISQLKWNRLNVAELRVTDGVVVLPPITALYSDAGLRLGEQNKTRNFQLTA